MFVRIILALWILLPTSALAQIVQFSGASSTPTIQFLADQYSGPTVLLSTTKERSAYGGNCMLLRRASDSTTQAIGWTGNKNCSISAFNSFCASTTCFLNTWYDQSGNSNDCIQATTAKQMAVMVDADSKISIQSASNGLGCEVADSASYKTAHVEVFAVIQGNAPPGGAQAGVVAMYGPTGGVNAIARWMIGNAYGENSVLGKFVQNAGGANYFAFGMAHVRANSNDFIEWNLTTETGQVQVDASHVLNAASGSVNITYGASSDLVVGNSRDYTSSFIGSIRMLVLYGTTRADKNSIGAFIESSSSQNTSPLLWTFVDGAGFNWTSNFLPPFTVDATDGFGLTWVHQYGGYQWPSFASATTNNSTTYIQFTAKPGDSDVSVTAAERAERSATGLTLAAGNDAEIFSQFLIPAGPTCVSAWCLTFQVHNDDASSVADMVFLNLLSETYQIVTQRNGTGSTNRGSSVGITRDAWMAIRFKIHWSINGTSDTLDVWLGLNGSTLTQIVSVSGALFATDVTSAYFKQGLYTGGTSNPISMQIANYQQSATAGAFSAFVTSQPALPTHP